MSSTRRTFLQQASAFGLLGGPLSAQMAKMPMPAPAAHPAMPAPAAQPPMLHARELPPFVDPLPLPRVIRPIHHGAGPGKLTVTMRETRVKLHRDVPATRLWVYADPAATGEPQAVGPVIEARSHQPLQIEWKNDLPTQHFLPIDYSLHGCGHDLPDVRACVHVHGAKARPKDDGQPEDWFVPDKSRTCLYPLDQEATALWYHDHAMGLNRLNIYAGLAGQFLLRDEVEDALHLPAGKCELPLTLYDRLFQADGQLYYPDSGDPEHPWVPEFAGDAILVNGRIRPYHEVEPRLYRLRVLNASNSSFFNLGFGGMPFHQIGSDQGLLSEPVKINHILLAPAERADLLVDLSQSAGRHVQLTHGAAGILELRVAATTPVPASIPAKLRPVPRMQESDAVVTRQITLNEYLDKVGNSMRMLLNRKHWHEPVTERPRLNTTEIWEFLNLTEDVHPMHLHLVRFQVLDRRVFEPFAYQSRKVVEYTGRPQTPEPGELGWKDTVQCPAGMVTRILVHFDGYAGRYLYHCHILEHESNDMMRPFEVIA